jgi:hypothetical protein
MSASAKCLPKVSAPRQTGRSPNVLREWRFRRPPNSFWTGLCIFKFERANPITSFVKNAWGYEANVADSKVFTVSAKLRKDILNLHGPLLSQPLFLFASTPSLSRQRRLKALFSPYQIIAFCTLQLVKHS